MKSFYTYVLIILTSPLLFSQSNYFQALNNYQAKDILSEYDSFSSYTISDSLLYGHESEVIRVFNLNTLIQIDSIALVDSYNAFPGAMKISQDGNSLWVCYTVSGNTDDRIYEYKLNERKWVQRAVFPGNFDFEFYKNEILVSGLNSSDFSSQNAIWQLDTINNKHKKIIDLEGSSGPVSVDEDNGLYYNTSFFSEPNFIFRWTESQLDSALSDTLDLTPEVADTISGLPAGSFFSEIDDAGNLIFNCNDFSGSKFIAYWNGDTGNSQNFIKIAESEEFLTFLTAHGDVTLEEPGNYVTGIAFAQPLSIISIPESNDPPLFLDSIQDFDFSARINNSININLKTRVTDPDNDDENIEFSLSSTTHDIIESDTIVNGNLEVYTGKNQETGYSEVIEYIVTAESDNQTVHDTFLISFNNIDYTNGHFLLNEGRFGVDPGSIHYFSDGLMPFTTDTVYARENPDQLGATSSYARMYDERIIAVSKNAPHVVLSDSETLQKIGEVTEIKKADGELVQAHSFTGVDENLGYISSTDGIFPINLATFEIGPAIDGSDGVSGSMLSVRGKTIAVQENRVLFIKDSEIIDSITGSDFGNLSLGKNGNVYVGKLTEILKINPINHSTEIIELPGNLEIPNPWFAWRASMLVSSDEENALFWPYTAGSFSAQHVYKYDLDDISSLEEPFIAIDTNYIVYGSGINFNPESNLLYISAIGKGFGENARQNRVFVYDAMSGEELNEISFSEYFWFPTLPFFRDDFAPESSIADIEVNENSNPIGIDLRDNVSDPDNINAGIEVSMRNIEDTTLLTAKVEYPFLNLRFKENQFGTSEMLLKIESNGIEIHDTIQILVNEVVSVSEYDNVLINVSPNPAQNSFRIETNISWDEITLHNLQGRIVKTGITDNSQVTIADLPKGVYFLKIKSDNKVYTKKLIKQ